MEAEDKGSNKSIKSKVGDASSLNKSASIKDGSIETKHAIGESEKVVIHFGMSRRYCSYWCDIFDLLQNNGGFIENTPLVNKTDQQRNAKLNKDIDLSNVTSPVIYNRLLCSPCSLLMKFSTISTSCSADSEGNVYTQIKSNETQTNQTNAKNSSNSNVETPLGTDASHTLKAKETEENLEKITTSTNKENPEAKAHEAIADVLKVSDESLDQSESKETDDQDTDIEETAGSGSDYKAAIDAVPQRKLTENSLEKDLPDDKSHPTSNVKTPSNEISPPEVNSDPPRDSIDTNTDKVNDKKLPTGENIQNAADKALLHEGSEGQPREKTVSTTAEASETKQDANQLNKPETNADGKQTNSEEKGTITVEGNQPETETDKKAALILEQLQSNFDDFQEQVVSKTDSYSNKLQNLEMMVIRLENQLLKEKLNKNNHSSTITRMENHILKLENELLRLNQSYSDIRQKSDSMVKDQKKYLELSHSSQQTPAYGYSAVSGRTNSISIEFQAKITYLTQLLSNQSMTIRHLKTRSEYLEDQNRLLYHMIMNQTALMTQIMTRVQDLTEQNIQQRIEAQKIRHEMDNMTSKRGMAGTTDRFLLDKLEEMVSDVQKKTLGDNDEIQQKQIKITHIHEDKSEQELEKYMQNESMSKTESWCGALSGTGVLATVVKTTCIPFSLLQWKVGFNRKETKKTSLKLSGTSTLKEDEKPIEKEKHTAKLPTDSQQTRASYQAETSPNAKTKEDSLVTTQTPNKTPGASSHTGADTNTVDSKVNVLEQEENSKESAEKELGKQGNFDTLPTQGESSTKDSSDDRKQVERSPTDADAKVSTHAPDGGDGKAEVSASDGGDGKAEASASDGGDGKAEATASDGGDGKAEATASDGGDGKAEASASDGGDGKAEASASDGGDGKAEATASDGGDGKAEASASDGGDGKAEASASDGGDGKAKTSASDGGDGKAKTSASDGGDGKAEASASEKDMKLSESASDSGDEKVKTSMSGAESKDSSHIADNSDNVKALDTGSDIRIDTADKSGNGNEPVDVNTKAAYKKDTHLTDEIKEKENTKPEKDEKLKIMDTKKHNMTDSQNKKETTSLSAEQKETKLTSGESVGKTEGRDATSAKDVQDANINTKPTKETQEKVESKKQDQKEQVKKEEVKKEIGNVKKEESKTEKPKSKSDEAVKVKSKEKKSEEPLKKPIKYLANGQKEPKDCYDYYKRGNKKSGVFKIKPYGRSSMVEVFCDMKNGGWTVIQKRNDGTTRFLKKWQDFKEGFGGIHGEHWLGNDYIHYLTNQDHYTLRIELTDWNKTKKFAEYDYFMIDDEAEGYRLHIGGYHGDAGDGMAKHNNHKFSTIDVDNDKVTKEFGGSCAKRFSGAWWYYKCYMSNLNGIFYRNGAIPPKLFDGITWKPWTGSNYSLRSAEMKIRPSNLA
ncbi:uncharacterized protein LOC117323087 [Pecten maximus]|uniref:uncharacterized protein LOC117323087 n=1 Tax=Pecten maximus TaxID=6579 RepID=UPI001458A5E8|nr:uncharacterized protein LOC117323087 [Pecten maximus]